MWLYLPFLREMAVNIQEDVQHSVWNKYLQSFTKKSVQVVGRGRFGLLCTQNIVLEGCEGFKHRCGCLSRLSPGEDKKTERKTKKHKEQRGATCMQKLTCSLNEKLHGPLLAVTRGRRYLSLGIKQVIKRCWRNNDKVSDFILNHPGKDSKL